MAHLAVAVLSHLLVLLTTVGLVECYGKTGGPSWLTPALIGGFVVLVLLACCCIKIEKMLFGGEQEGEQKTTEENLLPPSYAEHCGSGSVPRSEYVAMQRRLEQLEQKVTTMQDSEIETKELN